jgi:hypothetical protein
VISTASPSFLGLDIGGNTNYTPIASPTNSSAPIITLTAGTGGSLGAGDYYYNVYFVTADGHTSTIGIEAYIPKVTGVAASGKVTVENIPVSPDSRVTARVLMRSNAGGGWTDCYKLVQINDNTTTTYVDDGSISLDTSINSYRMANTTAGIITIDDIVATQTFNYNTSVGIGGLASATTGKLNTAFGNNSLNALTTGSSNSAFGYFALPLLTTGSFNTAAGFYALYRLTTASNNTAFGNGAVYGNQTGSNNAGVGFYALRNETTASNAYNAAIGAYSLYAQSTNNNYNSSLGYRAGSGFQGSYNVFIGSEAGYLSSATGIGNYNIFIGYDVGDNASSGAANNILIGKELDLDTAGGSNQLNIGGIIKGSSTSGSEELWLPIDSQELYFGAGKDAAIWYDGTNLHIDAQKVGSGILILENLPTSDPTIAGAVYNDSGTLKISAGA